MNLRQKVYPTFAVIVVLSIALFYSIIPAEIHQKFAWTVFFIGTVYLALTLGLMEYFVFYRLQLIESRLKEISRSEHKFRRRVIDISSNDEISRITNGINKVLDVLDKEKSQARLNKEMYASIVEDTPVLVQRFLPDGTITFVNDAYATLHEKDKEDFVGTNLYKLIDNVGGNPEMVKHTLRKLTPERPSCAYFYDTPIMVKNSVPRWTMWVNRAIYDEYERITEYQSVGIDMYHKSVIDSQLKNSCVSEMNIMRGIATIDGYLKYISSSSEDILGYKREELIGKKIFDYIHEEDQDDFIKYFNRCIEEKSTIIKEFRMKAAHKKTIWVQTTIEVIGDEKQTINLLINTIDITEIKKAHENIVIAHKELKDAMDKAEVINISSDKNPDISFVWIEGEEKMEHVSDNVSLLGYTARDFLEGRINLIDIVHPEDRDKFRLKHDTDANYRIVDKENNVYYVRDNTFVYQDKNKLVTYCKEIRLICTDDLGSRYYDKQNILDRVCGL